ncbi:MAG: TonB-dependent receptor, partial [Pedobacter sp.]
MSYGKTLLFIIFSLLSFTTSSQTVTVISGSVKDRNEAIEGVSIILKGTNIGTTTDASGAFSLTRVKAGTYTIVVSSLGYIGESRRIAVTADIALKLAFDLKKDSKQLSNVSIAGKTKTRELKESGFNVNAIDARQYANTTSDLNQVLNRTTGIRIREEGGMGSNFNFSLNGLSGKAVKFFIDGIPTDVMGSTMSLNNIPVNLAEQIEVFKGVVPVGLGADALGGAVNVTTNQNVTNYLDASYSLGSWATGRAALTGQYKHTPSGFVMRASGFYNHSNNNYLMKE